MIGEYVAAFNRCYPQKKIEVKGFRKRGELRFKVLIDGDAGSDTYTEDQLRSATRDFNRGRR